MQLERIQEIREADRSPVNGAVLATSSVVMLVIARLGNRAAPGVDSG